MDAGYSDKPLWQKLGVKENSRISILSAPENYKRTLGKLPLGVVQSDVIEDNSSIVQFFVTNRYELESAFPELKSALLVKGMLWICWPKKAAGTESGLDENVIRNIGLAAGLVDVKVIAIDATWSGLKFVYRLVDRPKMVG